MGSLYNRSDIFTSVGISDLFLVLHIQSFNIEIITIESFGILKEAHIGWVLPPPKDEVCCPIKRVII